MLGQVPLALCSLLYLFLQKGLAFMFGTRNMPLLDAQKFASSLISCAQFLVLDAVAMEKVVGED